MLIYRDIKHAERFQTPPGLASAINLQSVDDLKGRLWCVGDAFRLAGAPDAAWSDLEDGWQVRMTPEGPEPETLMYANPWAFWEDVRDGEGRTWKAPKILNPSGSRIFRTQYGGKDWLPILTEQQKIVECCAIAAREAFASEEQSAPKEAACAWADAFIRVLHPIAPGAVAACGILDDLLIIEMLKHAAGRV